MATVHGVAGSARVENLDGIQLTNQEKHGKRLDESSKSRVIYPGAKAVTTTGLDLHELYQFHINDPTTPNLLIPETQKGTKALHMIVHFPIDLVDGEDPELMIRHARGFVESIYGEHCVFADRCDRDEAGRHVVDLFLTPKYMKETACKRQWAVSVSKHGKENAKKWGYKYYNGPVNGSALQDQLHWYLKNVMCLEGVERGAKKKRRGKDWKSREQHIEEELEKRNAQLNDREAAVGDLEGQKCGLDAKGEELGREISKAQANTTETDEAKRRAKADEEVAKMARQQAEADAAAVSRALAEANADLAKLRTDQAQLKIGQEQVTADRATLKREKDEFVAAVIAIKPEQDKLAADRATLKGDQEQLALDQAAVSTLKVDQAALKVVQDRLAADQAALKAAQDELAKDRTQLEQDLKVAAAFEFGLVAFEKREIVGVETGPHGSKEIKFSQEMKAEPTKLEALKKAIAPAHDLVRSMVNRVASKVQELTVQSRDAYTAAQEQTKATAEMLISLNDTLSEAAKKEASKTPGVSSGLTVANNIVNNPPPKAPSEVDDAVLAEMHKRMLEQKSR